MVGQLEDEARAGDPAGGRPGRAVARVEEPGVPFRDGAGALAIAGQQPPGQLAVPAPGERHEALRVIGEERLGDPWRRLRAGEVRPRDEATEAPVPDVSPREQDEVRPALPRPDAPMVLPDRLAMAGEAGPRRLRSGREPAPRDRLGRPDGSRRPDRLPHPGRPAPRRDHEPVGIRGERIGQLDLDADHRVETGLFGGGGEADDTVEPLPVGDRERGEAKLQGGRAGGPLEEGEARVGVELGIGQHGHGTTPGAAEGRRRGRRGGGAGIKIEQTFDQVKPPTRLRWTQQTPPSTRHRWTMSTLARGSRSLLPTLLLVALVSALVLVVLPAVLVAAGGTAS